jgi:hypothetical protein
MRLGGETAIIGRPAYAEQDWRMAVFSPLSCLIEHTRAVAPNLGWLIDARLGATGDASHADAPGRVSLTMIPDGICPFF